MLPLTNTNASGLAQALTPNAMTVNGRDGYVGIWNATAQDLARDGGLNTITDLAARTSQTCYMRGVAEKLRIQTSSGSPWFHRRLCFALKSGIPLATGDTSASVTNITYADTSSGMQRLWLNLAINTSPITTAGVQNLVFKGTQGIDWNDAMVAMTDTAQVSIKYDRCRTYRSGNANGTVAESNLWHGMNKNLVYGDDESGQTNSTSYISTDGRPGMGDYYIMDIIQPGTGATVNDLLRINSSTTLYWHEK